MEFAVFFILWKLRCEARETLADNTAIVSRFGGYRVTTSCMLRTGGGWSFPHRLPSLPRVRPVGLVLLRKNYTMASDEASLSQQIAEQSALFSKLRADSSEPSLVEEARKKLAEMKKSLGLLKNTSSDGKDAGKKKERLLLKTAKVCVAPFKHLLLYN